uniref:Granulin n=1 Tax=Rhipicephalus appendiculatus TaxID=34631 RepID=A0A131YXV2_RHIAP
MVQKVSPVAAEPSQFEVSVNDLLVENIRCPDGNYCLDGQTCCLLSSGQYGCCPYQYAQCCSDHASCCPEGYLCKISTHQCIHTVSNHTVPMVQKVQPVGRPQAQASMPQVDAELIQCPDGSFCQNTQTCCLLNSGRYGCCPYAHAECCSDHVSCCPEGYRCKVSTKQCIHATSNHSMAAGQKVDAMIPEPALLPSRSNDVTCPDGHKCLSGQTCCPLSSTRYGCCPLPNAVCCDDDQHCCPEGYTCNEGSGTCELGDRSVPMVQKGPAFVDAALIQAAIRNEICPDGNECDDDQTCCQLRSGSYGCCPYNHAVCCDDKVHCCPEGYTCDTQASRCLNGNLASALGRIIQKRISRPMNRILVDEVKTTCPDQSTCPDRMTCCKSNNTYSCCPYNEATCCQDGHHCCPKGYDCDEARHMCTRRRRPEDLPWVN